MFLICEHPLLSHHNIPTLSEGNSQISFQSAKGAKFISELFTKQDSVRVRYSSGAHVKENAMACDTGEARADSSFIFHEILYDPIFAARFSCTDKVRLISHTHQRGGFIALNVVLLSNFKTDFFNLRN